jgi:hypothetical protein
MDQIPVYEQKIIEVKRNADHSLIFRYFQKSLSKKSSSKSLDRPDVIVKTIFRICRAFFASKLDDLKKKNVKKYGKRHKTSLLENLDNMIG